MLGAVAARAAGVMSVFFCVETPDLMISTPHDLAVHATTVMAHITACACTATSCGVPFIWSGVATKKKSLTRQPAARAAAAPIILEHAAA